MKPNEYNMKKGEKSLDDWIKVVKRIQGVKYEYFSGIKISDVPVLQRLAEARTGIITDMDIRLLIRILCQVSLLPNSIYSSPAGNYLVLKYNYDSNNEGFFSINSERFKYTYIVEGMATKSKRTNEKGIIIEINDTIESWKDEL